MRPVPLSGPDAAPPPPPRRLAFDRHEAAGAVGDLGTDLPLLMGMMAANGLDAASTFTVFGALQITSGVLYGLPVPVQPLKAIAAIMISTGAPKEQMFGAGLVLGVVMTLLAATNLITRIAELIPHCVVRGIQLGLGLSLATIALGYMQRDGWSGGVAAVVGVTIVLAAGKRPRVPPALLLLAIGVALAWLSGFDAGVVVRGIVPALPELRVPALADVATGGLRLAIPQIPLSMANSLIATAVLLRDLFPDRPTPSVRRVALTYGLMNLVAPFVSGVPVCHGSGGVAGQHRFGARTGGAPVIYGAAFVLLGGLFSPVVAETVKLFPFPILGVLLLFQALALVQLVGDVASRRDELAIALVVGILILGLPYGYAVGAVVGPILYHLARRGRIAL